MVCIPCILIPAALWIYMRFIQPLIMRILPVEWKQKFDNYFYSQQCPVKPPPPSKKTDVNGTECTVGDAATTNGDVQKTCPVMDKKRI